MDRLTNVASYTAYLTSPHSINENFSRVMRADVEAALLTTLEYAVTPADGGAVFSVHPDAQKVVGPATNLFAAL